MNNCYRFEKIKLKMKPIFNSIDATYIIHLEGNGRYNSILNELSKIIPSKNIYIVFNKGYKKCKKADFINVTNKDIVDANITIFNHSNKMRYENILILEDDFVFENINKTDSENIDKFMIKNKDKNISYLIGSLPLILIPTTDLNHWIGFFVAGMHSVIYTKKYRDSILEIKQEEINDWDRKDFFKLKKYVYKKPLCFQTFPITENRKNWFNSSIFELDIMDRLADIFINMLRLDKQIHPGYDIMYVFSKSIIFIIIFIIILILFKLFNKYHNQK